MSHGSTRRRLLKGVAGGLSLAHGLPWLAGCEQRDVPLWLTSDSGGWVGGASPRGHEFRDRNRPKAPKPSIHRRAHAIIIGAGVAGLSAARSLQRGGIDDYVVLELEDSAGGNSRGHQMAGMPCPLGAHYLPVPGVNAPELAQWLEELGLIRHLHGRWVGDERHLCHAPHERVFVPDTSAPAGAVWPGAWQEGLVHARTHTAETRRQFDLFGKLVRDVAKTCAFSMPTDQVAWVDAHTALDRMTMVEWIKQSGLNDPYLLWYLDYVCRDDYGASMTRVSAWAGLQYFAARHDLRGDGWLDDASPVLTWPEGNARLIRPLEQMAGDRLLTGQMVLQVKPNRRWVELIAYSTSSHEVVSWQAEHVILAVPLFVAKRMLGNALPALTHQAQLQQYAPWLVSNLLIDQPLLDRSGPALAWDNVIYSDRSASDVGVPSLGYVNAGHQNLEMPVGAQVWTHYWALGGHNPSDALQWRQRLLTESWQTWAQRVVADLAVVHPDLPRRLKRIDLMRYGHAMAIPEPGVRSSSALTALKRAQGRLHFAHADLSAYSVLEEAFAHGQRAARQVLRAVGISR